MSLTTTASGNFTIYEGTAAELAAVLKGTSKTNVVGFAYKGAANNYCLILAH